MPTVNSILAFSAENAIMVKKRQCAASFAFSVMMQDACLLCRTAVHEEKERDFESNYLY